MNKRLSPLARYHVITGSAYALGLLTCFIVNLAVSGGLTWFFIVLCSALVAFCVTNLPLLVDRNGLILTVAGVSIGVFPLLWVCHSVSGGSFSLRAAFSICAMSLPPFWLLFLTLRYGPLSRLLKSALCALIIGAFLAVCNPAVDHFVTGAEFSLSRCFSPTEWDIRNTGNKLAFYACAAYAVVAGIVGIARRNVRPSSRWR